VRRLARKPLVLLVTYLFIVWVCLIAFGVYLSEARRLIGANYTAMVTDVVRAQEDPERLRLILDSPDSIHLDQLNDLLWRIHLRMQGVKRQLERSEIAPARYQPLIDELDSIDRQLPALEEAIANVSSARGMPQAERRALLNLGLEPGPTANSTSCSIGRRPSSDA